VWVCVGVDSDDDDDERDPPCSHRAVSTALARCGSSPCGYFRTLRLLWRRFPRQARKQSFVRHTVREYHIHKALDHPNVVRLHDVFEIDANTFCTVLDYCTPPSPGSLTRLPWRFESLCGVGTVASVVPPLGAEPTSPSERLRRRVVRVFVVRSSRTGLICGRCARAGPNGDLDGYLKENRMLSEREARSILVQLFAGLAYLAHPKRRVIHYDLKVRVRERERERAALALRPVHGS